ncbi:MAG TPA: EamA family transporter [Candidatus Saccharimonadales bacterium]|nr:EamA family transporter [Candidatus Saccharimonadales bacterium]
MNWQTLAILQTIPAAAQVLMWRHIARGKRKFKAATINALTLLELWVCATVLAVCLGGIHLAQIRPYVGLMLLSGLAYAASTIFMYKSLEHLAAGIFSILQTSVTLFTIVLSFTFLHTTFRGSQWVGAAVLMLTIWTTLWLASKENKHLEKAAKWQTGVGYCLASALTLAIGLTMEKYMLSHVGTATYLVFGNGLQLVGAVVIAVAIDRGQGLTQLKKNKNVMSWLLGSGIMRGLAGVLFILAQVGSNNVALVSVIANFKIIIIAIFGALILREHKYFFHKLTTASLAVVGLALTLR